MVKVLKEILLAENYTGKFSDPFLDLFVKDIKNWFMW